MNTMSTAFEPANELHGFSGLAPIFPLPNLVLFPHAVQPLHIFEPRYRKLVADALAGERLIGLVLLKPGWESDYDGRPPIHEMACLGKITTDERLPGGKYNLVLHGLQRAVVVEETKTDKPYRMAQLELYKDFYPEPPVIHRDARRLELLSAFRRLFPEPDYDQALAGLTDANLPLGVLCDVLSFALQLKPARKQKLLEEVDVDQRSDLLLMRLRENLRKARGKRVRKVFPPLFSMN
jgi:Lon protease-like protein